MINNKFGMVTTNPRESKIRLYAPAHEVAPDVLIHSSFVNTYAFRTEEGVILIDPGYVKTSKFVYEAVRKWSSQPLHTAVYTHGHTDHAFGLGAFIEAGERPQQIIAQENLVKRFDRYRLTSGLNLHINQRQFGTKVGAFPQHFEYPTVTFEDTLVQRLGGLDIHYHAGKGETDDHCYIWIPEKSYLFTGDFIGWVAPNCGNPQKVQRYPVEWVEALEHMADLGAEWMFPGHGLVVHGKEAIRNMMLDIANYLRVIIDQVLKRMNAGQLPEEIFHAVEPDPELSTLPYLQAVYDHPKFIVRNLLRQWGGWWNGNAADLLPATWEEQAREVALLAGGANTIVKRGYEILQSGNTALAAHLAEWATRAEPENMEAQKLKKKVYEERMLEEPSAMAKGIFRDSMNQASTMLGEEQSHFFQNKPKT